MPNPVKCQEIGVVIRMSATFAIVIGRAGDGNKVVAVKLPVDVLEGVMPAIGVIKEHASDRPVAKVA
jgi:hypothetical protein